MAMLRLAWDQTTLNGCIKGRRNANRLRPQARTIGIWRSGGAGFGPQKSGGLAKLWQRQVTRGAGLVEQVAGHLHAAAAARTGTGAHGQLGHGLATGLGGLTDVVIG